MPPSGVSERGVIDGERSVETPGTTDQCYDARPAEGRRRHQANGEEEDQEHRQSLEEHSTRSISTFSQRDHFCNLLRCYSMKYDRRKREDRIKQAHMHHIAAPKPQTVEPNSSLFFHNVDAEASPAQAGIGMENRTSRAYGESPAIGTRTGPRLKSSVHSLRNRLKTSMSNMSLRTAFQEDVQDEIEPDPRPRQRLRTAASKSSLWSAFRGPQSYVDEEPDRREKLRNAFSNMSLRRAFRRKEPQFADLPEDEAEETITPRRQKRLAMHGVDLLAGGHGLREAISNMSLRSSGRTTSRFDDRPSEESISGLDWRRYGKPEEDAISRVLRQSRSTTALRAGVANHQPEYDELRSEATPTRRNRLAIAGRLPPRGARLTPPLSHGPRDGASDYQVIAKPEAMIHNSDAADPTHVVDFFVATRISSSTSSSILRRIGGGMATLDCTAEEQRYYRFCDPKTLAILNGAPRTPSTHDSIGHRPDYEASFARFLATRYAGRNADRGDDGYRPRTSTSSRPRPSSSLLHRDDVSELRDSELFAVSAAGTRSVSPITIQDDDDSGERTPPIVRRYLEQVELQRESSSSILHSAMPELSRSTDTLDCSSIRTPGQRRSGESLALSAVSWAQGNANDYQTFMEAAENGMI